jgi:hypothetical protein
MLWYTLCMHHQILQHFNNRTRKRNFAMVFIIYYRYKLFGFVNFSLTLNTSPNNVRENLGLLLVHSTLETLNCVSKRREEFLEFCLLYLIHISITTGRCMNHVQLKRVGGYSHKKVTGTVRLQHLRLLIGIPFVYVFISRLKRHPLAATGTTYHMVVS